MTEEYCEENFKIDEKNKKDFTIYGDFYEGETLEKFLRDTKPNKIRYDTLFRIGRQVLSVFFFFEKIQCINFDIKALNIMIQSR